MDRPLLSLLFLIPFSLYCQEKLQVEVVKETAETLVNLNNSAYFIADKEQNHLAVDLVEAYTVDSTFTRKTG